MIRSTFLLRSTNNEKKKKKLCSRRECSHVEKHQTNKSTLSTIEAHDR
jgi:hypothetical protein